MDVNKKTTHLGICERCKKEKTLNRFGLCRNCDEDVQQDYNMMYSPKNMEM